MFDGRIAFAHRVDQILQILIDDAVRADRLADFVLGQVVRDQLVRGTTSEQIIQMARDAGAKKVYFASAAPPVRYPNVYGIDMPSAEELVAHGRSDEEVQTLLGCDWLIYQDLSDLEQAVSGPKHRIENFDSSCFNGDYVTGIEPGYFERIQQLRSDEAKNTRRAS